MAFCHGGLHHMKEPPNILPSGLRTLSISSCFVIHVFGYGLPSKLKCTPSKNKGRTPPSRSYSLFACVHSLSAMHGTASTESNNFCYILAEKLSAGPLVCPPYALYLTSRVFAGHQQKENRQNLLLVCERQHN